MNILFLGGLFTPDNRQEIISNSKGVIQYAANSLQWSFIKGLDDFYNLKIINLPFVGSYPFRFKKINLSSFSFEHTKGSKDVNVGFINLSVIKQLFRYNKAKKELIKSLCDTTDVTTIIIYSIHSPFLRSAVESKKFFPDTKICLIVPDLPEYMSDSHNIFYRMLKKIDSIIIEKALKEIDSFVLLSDNMAKELNINGKPWVRVEGISDYSGTNNLAIKEKNKTILYTGTIAHRYGVMNLVDAFINIKSDNYRLWICGEGNSRKEIEKIAFQDNRISYLGQRSHEEVLLLQKKATVLVNPRTSEGEYTKFSFPSKIMEYFASGTPTIMNRLPGIPEEYFQFCFVPSAEDVNSLKETILYVCEKDQKELDEFGSKAALFIKENKNPYSQVKRIYDMLNSM